MHNSDFCTVSSNNQTSNIKLIKIENNVTESKGTLITIRNLRTHTVTRCLDYVINLKVKTPLISYLTNRLHLNFTSGNTIQDLKVNYRSEEVNHNS